MLRDDCMTDEWAFGQMSSCGMKLEAFKRVNIAF
jgi:hypothetical protein